VKEGGLASIVQRFTLRACTCVSSDSPLGRRRLGPGRRSSLFAPADAIRASTLTHGASIDDRGDRRNPWLLLDLGAISPQIACHNKPYLKIGCGCMIRSSIVDVGGLPPKVFPLGASSRDI